MMKKKSLVAEEFELRNSMTASEAESSAQMAQLTDRFARAHFCKSFSPLN